MCTEEGRRRSASLCVAGKGAQRRSAPRAALRAAGRCYARRRKARRVVVRRAPYSVTGYGSTNETGGIECDALEDGREPASRRHLHGASTTSMGGEAKGAHSPPELSPHVTVLSYLAHSKSEGCISMNLVRDN